ncbi:hypothetical protein NP233_g7232 [Leucocoprinus birnbaumii]|uniref:NACHT domain-containing protein n=1 Tax=Leucocoprinus birnbaumii TaxID=56174 RepID=A0AAD5VPP9_9AGAR|nr:hypothetical protein NP233_g7232 [Leucocoprinus birnbaumii]
MLATLRSLTSRSSRRHKKSSAASVDLGKEYNQTRESIVFDLDICHDSTSVGAGQSLLKAYDASTVENAGPSTGILAKSHHNIFNNVNLIESHHHFDGTHAAIQALDQRRMAGAEFDSSARHPAPQCHPQTRVELRNRIDDWLDGSLKSRSSSMLWVTGSAGVGKTAVAQTVAQRCNETGRLGGTFFFSRPGERNDPERVIPTLAHQFAIRIPDYRKIIAHILMHDSTILEKDVESQFRKLISEPFALMKRQNTTWVIILDGLDECQGSDAQIGLIELISAYIRNSDASNPTLWLICSRPEWQFRQLFSNSEFMEFCIREEILIDSRSSRADVSFALEAGFQGIRGRYWDVFSPTGAETWPSVRQLRELSLIASGLFIFASTVLQFVGDAGFGDPVSRLETCLAFLRSPENSSCMNPLYALDLLYGRVLADVPSEIAPVTITILGFHILQPDNRMPARAVANFLCLDQRTFYKALRMLHSILFIPDPDEAGTQRLRIHHTSLIDFLRNEDRSGKFSLKYGKAEASIAVQSIKWYNHYLQLECKLRESAHENCNLGLPDISWPDSQRDNVPAQYSRLQNFAKRNCWKLCHGVSNENLSLVTNELLSFNFCHMRSVVDAINFSRFLSRLSEVRENGGLIRTRPVNVLDRKLLRGYSFEIARRPQTLNQIETKVNGGRLRAEYHVSSVHTLVPMWNAVKTDWHWRPIGSWVDKNISMTGVFWLGNGDRTCVVTEYYRFIPEEPELLGMIEDV